MTPEELVFGLRIVDAKIHEFEEELTELQKEPNKPDQWLKIEKASTQLATARAWKRLIKGG